MTSDAYLFEFARPPPRLDWNQYFSGIHVGKGYSDVDMTISPGQSKQIYSLQNFQKNSLSPAISSIISNGGIMEIRVSGTAHFSLFGINIPVYFESTKQISVYNEIKKN